MGLTGPRVCSFRGFSKDQAVHPAGYTAKPRAKRALTRPILGGEPRPAACKAMGRDHPAVMTKPAPASPHNVHPSQTKSMALRELYPSNKRLPRRTAAPCPTKERPGDKQGKVPVALT